MLKHLPNALTLARLILSPVVAWAVWQAHASPQSPAWAVWAAVLFVIAALTDLFDGMAARAFGAGSKFGRIIDPIADKALVGMPLIVMAIIALAMHSTIAPVVVAAAVIIVVRDIAMTVIRLTAPDGEGVPVIALAKWKTAIELVAVGAPIIVAAVPAVIGGAILAAPVLAIVWVVLLVLAAALSAYTAFRYVTAKP